MTAPGGLGGDEVEWLEMRAGIKRSFLDTPDGKHALGLSAEWTPVAPIIVGHPKSAPAPVSHKEPEIRWIG